MQISKQISKHYFLIIKYCVNKYKKSMLNLLFRRKFKNELGSKTTLNWSQGCICIYLYSISSAVDNLGVVDYPNTSWFSRTIRTCANKQTLKLAPSLEKNFKTFNSSKMVRKYSLKSSTPTQSIPRNQTHPRLEIICLIFEFIWVRFQCQTKYYFPSSRQHSFGCWHNRHHHRLHLKAVQISNIRSSNQIIRLTSSHYLGFEKKSYSLI